jgi:hypothetical protein
MMKILLVVLLSALLLGCSDEKSEKLSEVIDLQKTESKILIAIPEIAGKELASVEAYLGVPKECVTSKYGKTCTFSKRDIEIVFIDEKADWITINSLNDLSFSPNAIAALGFAQTPPSFAGQEVIRWENIPAIKELSLFAAGDSVHYAYIKTSTP